MREILELSTSVYKVDIELLKRLKPDVIVTQTQCEICAVSLKDLDGFLKDELSHQVRYREPERQLIERFLPRYRKGCLSVTG